MGTHEVGTLVFAKSREEAETKARRVFNKLVKGCTSYDYYGDGFRSGDSARLTPHRADSAIGKQAIERIEANQARGLGFDLTKVREGLGKTSDEEILNGGGETGMLRHYMYKAGQYQGTAIQLYSDEGEGLQDHAQIQTVLDHYPSLRGKGGHKELEDPVWIVVTAMHY